MGQCCGATSLLFDVSADGMSARVDLTAIRKAHSRDSLLPISDLPATVSCITITNVEGQEEIPSLDSWGLPSHVTTVRCHSSLTKVKVVGDNFLADSLGLVIVDCAALRNVGRVGKALFCHCPRLEMTAGLGLWTQVETFDPKNAPHLADGNEIAAARDDFGAYLLLLGQRCRWLEERDEVDVLNHSAQQQRATGEEYGGASAVRGRSDQERTVPPSVMEQADQLFIYETHGRSVTQSEERTEHISLMNSFTDRAAELGKQPSTTQRENWGAPRYRSGIPLSELEQEQICIYESHGRVVIQSEERSDHKLISLMNSHWDRTLMKYGEANIGLVIILEGTVSAIGRDDSGGKVYMGNLNPGDVLGEIEFIYKQNLSADFVTASEGVRVASMTQLEFERVVGSADKVLQREPEINRAYRGQLLSWLDNLSV